MSELDKAMSNFLGQTGARPEIQLRTRYFDEVVTLKKKGFAEPEIGNYLKQKFIKENPEQAAFLFGEGVTQPEFYEHLEKAGLNPDEIEPAELENLKKTANLVRGLSLRKAPKKAISTKGTGLTKWIYLKSVSAGWAIWLFFVFSINSMGLIHLYDSNEIFAWTISPPIICTAIFFWVKYFVSKK